MSELSREQVEYLVSGNPDLGSLGEQLLAHDFALRAKLEAMTQERDEIGKLYKAGCDTWDPVYKIVLDSRDELRQQLAASEQRVKELEEESRQWEKASLVGLLRERDQLQATITAQQEEIAGLKACIASQGAQMQAYHDALNRALASGKVKT